MGSRLASAAVALIAAVLLAVAAFGHSWWDGPPVVSGEVRHMQAVHVGPRGGEMCNPGGDGSCRAMPLVGGFTATGYIVVVVVGLLAAAAAVLGVLLALDHEKKASVGKAMFGGTGASLIVAIAFFMQEPTLTNTTQPTSMPHGAGIWIFLVGAVGAVVAGVIARRVPERLMLRSAPYVPTIAGSPLDILASAQPAPSSPGGPLPGLAGPLGVPFGGNLPVPASQPGVAFTLPVAPPAPHFAAQFDVPPPPPPTPPVGMAVQGPPSQPQAIVTPNPDRPRTLPPPPRAKSSSIPTPHPDRSRTAIGPATVPPPLAGLPRPGSTTNPPPVRSTAISTAPPLGPRPQTPSKFPPTVGTRPGAPLAAGSRPGSLSKPPFPATPPATGNGVKPAPLPSVTRKPPGPSTAPVLKAAVPFPDPQHRVPTTNDDPSLAVGDTTSETTDDGTRDHAPPSRFERTDTGARDHHAGAEHTDINAQPLDVGDHTSPSVTVDGPDPLDRDPRGSFTDVVELGDSTSQTHAPDVRNAASTDVVPTLAAPPATKSSPMAIALSTADSALPPPTAQQAVAVGPSPACPQCEAPMAWVEAHLRFYCKSCKMYF